MSVKTVETHVSAVLRKLQLSSRHQLTAWANERRLVYLSEGEGQSPSPSDPPGVALRTGSKACPSSAPKALTTVSLGHGIPE